MAWLDSAKISGARSPPLDEGAQAGDGFADDERIHLACTNDFDLCLEAPGEAGPELNVGGLGIQGYGCPGGSQLLVELVAMEMARFDASIATFFGVHSGLAIGSIALVGSR